MHFSPYIQFNGNCREALAFYQTHLGASTQVTVPFSDMPEVETQIPDKAWHEKVMHAEWKIGEQQLMSCDAPPGMYKAPQGFYINLMMDDIDQAEKIYQVLSEAGQIHMPMAESFFAHRFAMLVDRFGIPWMVAVLKQPE